MHEEIEARPIWEKRAARSAAQRQKQNEREFKRTAWVAQRESASPG